MKKHKVILHPDAELDMESSFKWGCRAWGEENAKLWVRKLRRTFRNQLTSMPLAYPLAPESEQLGVSIRHLIVGRYRIHFTVKGRTVTILHRQRSIHRSQMKLFDRAFIRLSALS